MNKQLLAACAISIMLAGIIPFLSGENPLCTGKKIIQKEEEQEIPLQDRMDLAIQQEFDITKDPATNTVPRERLLHAMNYSQQLRTFQGNYRMGAISNVNWTERGPNNIGGRTRAILVDPNDATKKSVFAAGVAGGIWKTSDITASNPSWIAVDDFFSDIAITTITYNPLNTQELYFGTGEGYFNIDAVRGLGIWKSSNGGSTWNQLVSTGNPDFYYINKMIVHSSGDVYAATRNGLFRSQDGGSTWIRVLGSSSPGGAPTDNFSDVEIAADHSIWAATLGANGGVFRSSTGNGSSWTQLNTGSNGFPITGFRRIEMACAPSGANVCYAYVEGMSTLLNFYKTVDGGATWVTLPKPVDAESGIGSDLTRSQAWYNMSIAVDPNNSNTVFTGGIDLFKSTTGGASWQQISHWYGGFGFQYVHADQHIALFEPGNSNVIYFGNDGGIWRCENAAAAVPSIAEKNNSYNVTQYYACAMHPAAYSNYFLAGAQDNGTHKFSSAGMNSVTSATDGDGCFCHIDQDEPQFQWTSYIFNSFYRSTDGGNTWTNVGFGGGSFVSPTDYDNASNVLYATAFGGNYLRWTDPQTGSTSDVINVTSFSGSNIRHVSVSQNTPNRVFFGLSNGSIVRVDNANTVSSPVAGALVGTPAAGSVSCVAIENGNDNHILVTYSNYGVTSVWESTNALSATPSFSSIEGNLPDMPVRWALFDPLDNHQAMLATEVGVWSTDLLNGGLTNWSPSNSGLANTRIDMLQVRSSDHLVAAATHGRGLFTSDAFTSPHPDFTVSSQVTYTNKTIRFTDESYQASSWNWIFGDGGTSSGKNPAHVYSTPGIYTVTLIINNNNIYTSVKTGYIQVLPDRGTPYTVLNGDGGSFDSNLIDFAAENISGTPFERGNSSVAGKSGTATGANAWVTGLTASNYANNTNDNLYTPNFNLSANGTYTLSFFGKWRVEQDYDGFRLEYSMNKGSTWNELGGLNPGTWYNFSNAVGNAVFPSNDPFFCSDTATVFKKYSLDITFLEGNHDVAFRFVFKSDDYVTRAGIAIDNFEINGPPNSSLLPVEMLSFTGEPKEKYNLLLWTTASEINNRGFEIQRSENAVDFINAGFVSGSGNSSQARTYSFMDSDVINKILYYRLRQLDFDGREKLSDIIAIHNKNNSNLAIETIYPIPFVDHLSILLNKEMNEPACLKMYAADGNLCIAKDVTTSSRTLFLETSKLAAGVYFLTIESGSETLVQRIAKSQ